MRRKLCLCLALTLAAAFRTNNLGQATDAAGSAADGKPAGALLRTYVNLVQIPVLVLSSEKQPLPPIPGARFHISIDSGPLFAPRHVRRENNDPLRILVLVEQSSLSKQALETIPESLASLNTLLMPQDRIWVAASSGCVLVNSGTLSPGAEVKAAALRVMERATSVQTGAAQQKECRKGSRLWDDVASSLVKLKDDPSRKVLLLFTNGTDQASRLTPLQVQNMATRAGVSIFAIRRDDPEPQTAVVTTVGGFEHSVYRAEGDPLIMLAESSGGMVMEGRHVPLEEEVSRLIAIVRGRYIVDFVRPTSMQSGSHTILVSVGDHAAFVRAGGTSVPLPSPEETNDPDRVPADHSEEPPVGTRRILK